MLIKTRKEEWNFSVNSLVFGSNWKFKMLVFVEGGKLEYLEKYPLEQPPPPPPPRLNALTLGLEPRQNWWKLGLTQVLSSSTSSPDPLFNIT